MTIKAASPLEAAFSTTHPYSSVDQTVTTAGISERQRANYRMRNISSSDIIEIRKARAQLLLRWPRNAEFSLSSGNTYLQRNLFSVISDNRNLTMLSTLCTFI